MTALLLALAGGACVVFVTWTLVRVGWGVRPRPVDYVALALIAGGTVIGGRMGYAGTAIGGLIGFVIAAALRLAVAAQE